MTRREMHGALDRAASEAVDRDFAVAAWGRGRVLRRRRQIGLTTAGGFTLAAAAVGAIFLGGIGQDTAQPPLDPATTPVSTDAPTTTDGEQIDDQADRSSPSDIVAQGPFFADPILVLGPPVEEQSSRELTPATTEELSGREWTLLEPSPQAWTVVGPDDGAVTLGFDGSDWSVRGCGLDMSAPGDVTDGAATLAGDWTQREAPEAGAGCEGTLWSVAQNWQQLFSEEPLIAQDGDTLVLVHSFVPAGEVEVSIVFEDVSEDSAPGDGTRDPVAADLDTFWQEVPAEQALDQIPPAVDLVPETAALWSGGDGAIEFYSPCSGQQAATWLLDTGRQVLLIGLRGSTDPDTCEPGAVREQDLAEALLSSVPAVQMVDGRFVVRGSVPQDMVADVPAVARPTQPLCSAQTLADAPVRTGSAPQPVIATANGLATAARDCDQNTLVEIVQTDETTLSFGAPDPAVELDVSEPDEERYAILVSLLTQDDPVAHPATEDQSAYYEWGGGQDGLGWRIGITADGTWSYFLAGE